MRAHAGLLMILGVLSGVLGTAAHLFTQVAPAVSGSSGTIVSYVGAFGQLGALGILGYVSKLLLTGALVPRDVAAATAKLARLVEEGHELARESVEREAIVRASADRQAALVDRLLTERKPS